MSSPNQTVIEDLTERLFSCIQQGVPLEEAMQEVLYRGSYEYEGGIAELNIAIAQVKATGGLVTINSPDHLPPEQVAGICSEHFAGPHRPTGGGHASSQGHPPRCRSCFADPRLPSTDQRLPPKEMLVSPDQYGGVGTVRLEVGEQSPDHTADVGVSEAIQAFLGGGLPTRGEDPAVSGESFELPEDNIHAALLDRIGSEGMVDLTDSSALLESPVSAEAPIGTIEVAPRVSAITQTLRAIATIASQEAILGPSELRVCLGDVRTLAEIAGEALPMLFGFVEDLATEHAGLFHVHVPTSDTSLSPDVLGILREHQAVSVQIERNEDGQYHQQWNVRGVSSDRFPV